MIRLKKGFRRFAAAALCLVLAMTAAGCGGKGSDDKKKPGGQSGSVTSSMPEITSKDGVVTSRMVSLGEDFTTDGLQVLAMEDGTFTALTSAMKVTASAPMNLYSSKKTAPG